MPWSYTFKYWLPLDMLNMYIYSVSIYDITMTLSQPF